MGQNSVYMLVQRLKSRCAAALEAQGRDQSFSKVIPVSIKCSDSMSNCSVIESYPCGSHYNIEEICPNSLIFDYVCRLSKTNQMSSFLKVIAKWFLSYTQIMGFRNRFSLIVSDPFGLFVFGHLQYLLAVSFLLIVRHLPLRLYTSSQLSIFTVPAK